MWVHCWYPVSWWQEFNTSVSLQMLSATKHWISALSQCRLGLTNQVARTKTTTLFTASSFWWRIRFIEVVRLRLYFRVEKIYGINCPRAVGCCYNRTQSVEKKDSPTSVDTQFILCSYLRLFSHRWNWNVLRLLPTELRQTRRADDWVDFPIVLPTMVSVWFTGYGVSVFYYI